MILVSHEIPKQLFPLHDLISDYPYVLGHLLNEDKEYTEFYKAKLESAKYSILDNSAFELNGESLTSETVIDLAREYRPTHVVMPDIVNDFYNTQARVHEFVTKLTIADIETFEFIGVAQGCTFKEITNSVKMYIKGIPTSKTCADLYHAIYPSIIALPFDLVPDSEWITVRYRFLKELVRTSGVNLKDVKFHLLGCYNPIEFKLITSDPEIRNLIHSVDTSSPIVNGWNGQLYSDHGMVGSKPKDKLAENLNINLNEVQLSNIIYNVKKFREFINS